MEIHYCKFLSSIDIVLVIVLNPILVIYILLDIEIQHVVSKKIDIKLACLFHLFSLPFAFVFLVFVLFYFLKYLEAKHSYNEIFLNLPLWDISTNRPYIEYRTGLIRYALLIID